MLKYGLHGRLFKRGEYSMGEAVILNGVHKGKTGYILSRRNGSMQYATIQVESEIKGRYYIVNLLTRQYEDKRVSVSLDV